MSKRSITFAGLILYMLVCCQVNGQAPQEGMEPASYNFTSFTYQEAIPVLPEWRKQVSPEFHEHPDFGRLPERTPCEDCYELLQERDEYTRIFARNGSNGTYIYKQQGYKPLNFKNKQGQWIASDHRLRPGGSPDWVVAPNQMSPTRINLREEYTASQNGQFELLFNRKLTLVHESGGREVSLGAANWQNATVGDDGMYVRNAWPGVDLQIVSHTGGFKSSIILNRPLNLQGGFLRVRDHMQIPSGLDISTLNGELDEYGFFRGEIYLEAQGEEIFRINQGVVYDAAELRESARIIGYEIGEDGIFDMIVPVEYLNDGNRIYPVTIDPLVTSSNTVLQGAISGSMYNASCTFTNACPQYMTVNTPINCTITNIRWDFDYRTQGICWLNDGAVDFRYSTCRSPGNSSFYWYCNLASPGTCNGSNISIFNDLSSCVPAPQCASYPMNFTMNFYRRCYGSWGCNNACVGANSNWMMIVEGRTLEFSNTTTPATVSPTAICLGSSVNLNTSGTMGVPGYTVQWSTNPGFTNIIATGSSTSYTPTSTGAVTLYVRIIDQCNIVQSSSVVVNVDAPPTTSNAGPNQTICANSTTLAGNTPTVGTGNWTRISGSGNISNPSSPTSTVTGLGLGNNVFQWTISNGLCPPSTSTVTITVQTPPTTANAGPNQTLCNTTTGTLAGNNPSVGSGTWTVISGPATVSNPSSPNSGVTGLGIGANVFQWSISNGGCPPSTDQVTITVDQAPTTANAGPNQTLCATSATLAGNNPAIGSGTWTLVSGSGTITNASSPTSGVTGLGVGNNVFQWSITNGVCPPSTDQVTITVLAPPTTANAGPNQTLCNTTTATLAGNNPAVGSGVWTVVSGPATVTNPSSPNSGVTGLGTGANVFQWTITNGSCPPSSDQVTITIDQAPTTANAGPNQTICTTSATLAGNAATVGTGTWTLVSGSGTITNASSPTSGVTGLAVGNNVFQWSITNGVCPPSTDQITITVLSATTPANAGSDQTLCAATTTNLSGNTPSAGSGAWTVIAGSATVTTPSSPTSGVTGLSTGTNTFVWTITNAPCPVTTDTVSVFVDAAPTTSNAGPDQTICATSATLAGNAPTSGTGTWTLVSGSGTITNPSAANSGVTGLAVGTNTFQWTISNGSCPSSTDQVNIIVDAAPSTANAGPNQTLCNATTATLAGNNPAVGSGTWTLQSGSGSATTPGSPTSGVTGLATGANVFQWTISNGVCPPSTDQVTITVDPAPTTANAGPDQAICSLSATLAGNNPTVGTGTWTQIAGSGSIANPSSATSGVSSMSVGTNTFVWSITSGICPASTDTVNIVVTQPPTTSNAGPDQTICATSATLAGNTPTNGTGTWTLAAGSGTITNSASPSSGVTGLGVGTNSFVWTIAGGACPPSRDTVNIIVDANPTTANAGTDQTLCATSTSMSANAPAVGNGTWSLIAGSGTPSNASSPTSGVSGLSVGTNTLVWTISNGVCPASTDTVNVVVDPQPTTANAGPDQTICIGSGVNLAGNAPATGTGTWTLVAGSGTIANPSSPTSGVSGLAVGTNTFQWSITNGVCPPSTDQVNIIVDDVPTTASAGPDQNVCGTTATLAGNNPAVGTGTWTLVSGSGTPTNPNDPNSGVTGLTSGANVFQWSISNGVCPPSTDQVTITVDLPPTPANAGAPQTICEGDNVTLSGNTPFTGTGLWTGNTGTITNPGGPVTDVTGLPAGNHTFTWTITNGTCPPSTSTVTVTVDAPPGPANAGADQSFCDDQRFTNMAATAPTTGSGTWTRVVGTGNIGNTGNPTAGVSNLQAGTNIFVWTVSNGVCPDVTDTVVIEVKQTPDADFAVDADRGCVPHSVIISSTGTGGSSFEWQLGDGTTFSNANPDPVVYTYPAAGQYSVQLIVEENGCSDTLEVANFIDVGNQPIADFISNPPIPGQTGVNMEILFTNQSQFANTYVWDFGDGSSSQDENPVHSYAAQGSFCITLTAESDYGCEDEVEYCTMEIVDGSLFVPNAFTPNGDGINDEFEAIGRYEFETYTLDIFDRWGKLIWSGNWGDSWNGMYEGKFVGEGTYVYKITALTTQGQQINLAGSVMIVK